MVASKRHCACGHCFEFCQRAGASQSTVDIRAAELPRWPQPVRWPSEPLESQKSFKSPEPFQPLFREWWRLLHPARASSRDNAGSRARGHSNSRSNAGADANANSVSVAKAVCRCPADAEGGATIATLWSAADIPLFIPISFYTGRTSGNADTSSVCRSSVDRNAWGRATFCTGTTTLNSRSASGSSGANADRGAGAGQA